jgi:hypothetical protein
METVAAAKGEADGHHAHVAPHGGALVAFGEHLAHIEFVLDSGSGELTAYVLDAEAEAPIRIAQRAIELLISNVRRVEGGALAAPPLTLRLAARANPLTGEMVGDSSEFSAQSERLKDAAGFEVTLAQIALRGQVFKDVRFNFPTGSGE